MKIGVHAAKSKPSGLLDKVRSGKEIVITGHGEPIAKLVPIAPVSTADRARAVRQIRALSRRLNIVTRVPLRKRIEKGRD